MDKAGEHIGWFRLELPNEGVLGITGQKTGQTFSGKFETLYKGKVVDTGTWKTIPQAMSVIETTT